MRARRRPFIASWMLLLPAAVFLTALMAYPVGRLLLLSVHARDGGWTGANYGRLIGGASYWRVLGITLRCAGWTTVLAVLFSYPLAYLIATSRNRTRAWLTFWVMLPFWTSFLVRTFAWVVLLGRRGVLNQWMGALGLIDAPLPMLFSFPAVMVGMLHALMPLCVLTMLSVMEGIDGNLSRAAMTLGAPRGSTFWRIYVPLSLPGVAAGALLVFISSLGFFITPALLGGPREIMLPQIIIQQVQELLNWPFAGALAVLMVVTVLAVFAVFDRAVGLSSLAGMARTGGDRPPGPLARAGNAALAMLGGASDGAGAVLARPFRARADRAGWPWGRWALMAAGLLALGFLAVPSFLMVPVSFTAGSVLEWPPRFFSFRWYDAFLSSPVWLGATLRSFEVALLTAVLSMLIGTPAAVGLLRGLRRGNAAALGLLLSPLIVPRIIVAVALFYLYARLNLIGTVTGLVLGHTVLAIPYVVVTVMAVLKTYDPRYDAAAGSLGANRLRTLWHVTLPLLRAGLVAAFLFAFVTSFDELTVALFVTGGLTATLPKQMWDSAVLSVDPTLAAISTLLLLLITAVLLTAGLLGRRDSRLRA